MQHSGEKDADYERLDFAYNADGLRVQKRYTRHDSEGMQITITDYILHGKNIVHMRVMKNETVTDEMYFFYDAQGRPALTENTSCASGITSTEIYAYIHNLQGDTVGLLDASGNECVRYTYDAWGRMISISGAKAATLGLLQPFRYRGYVYDEETGLFYLRSRYYNPTWGRFISADINLGENNKLFQHNLFLYCKNSPVIFIDSDGFGWFLIAAAFIGAVVGAVTQMATNLSTGEPMLDGVVGAAVGGAVYNIVSFTTGNTALAAYSSATAESLTNEAIAYISGEKELTKDNLMESATSVALDTALTGTVYFASGNISGKQVKINRGWIKPKKFVSSFTGKYARKVMAQTAVQGAYNYIEMTVEGRTKHLLSPLLLE